MFWKKARAQYGHLTAEDEDIKKYLRISSDFQQDGYEGLVGYIHDIGHRWIAQHTIAGPTLEIGFGAGRHGVFFAGKYGDYYVSEYSVWNFQSDIWENFRGRGVCCDARSLPYCDVTFQSVISIYNLEHIADLSRVFQEVHRVLKPTGRFLIALPCEGGFLWNIGRELTTRPQFQKQYGLNYDKIIAYEHVWDLVGVFEQIKQSELFHIKQCRLYPFLVPTHHLNLIACVECSVISERKSII
jgi:SAM-dependent methyltransferase